MSILKFKSIDGLKNSLMSLEPHIIREGTFNMVLSDKNNDVTTTSILMSMANKCNIVKGILYMTHGINPVMELDKLFEVLDYNKHECIVEGINSIGITGQVYIYPNDKKFPNISFVCIRVPNSIYVDHLYRIIKDKNIDVFICDGLSNLNSQDTSTSKNKHLLGKIAAELKVLALTENIPVIVSELEYNKINRLSQSECGNIIDYIPEAKLYDNTIFIRGALAAIYCADFVIDTRCDTSEDQLNNIEDDNMMVYKIIKPRD